MSKVVVRILINLMESGSYLNGTLRVITKSWKRKTSASVHHCVYYKYVLWLMSMSPPGCDGELVLLNLITDLQTSAIVSSLTTTFRWARDTVARRPNILQSTSKGRKKGVDPKMVVKFVFNWLILLLRYLFLPKYFSL